MMTKSFKNTFEIQLKKYLNQKKSIIAKIGKESTVYDMYAYIDHLSLGGKRIRPYLLFASYTHFGGKKDITQFLLSIELLHIFALIHDDIMDRSPTRHNTPTAHEYFKKYYTKTLDKDHLALSQALLLGDLVYTWSHELIQTEKTSKEVVQFKKIYYEMAQELVLGQALDVDSMDTSRPQTKTELAKKIMYKSGNYSIMHPLILGATLAHAKEKDIAFLKKYGTLVGQYFQIQDDLLDIKRRSNNQDKPLYKDIHSGQQTYVTQYLLTHPDSSIQKEFIKYFHKETLSETEVHNLHTLLERSQVSEVITQELTTLEKKIIRTIDTQQKNTLWKELFQMIKDRSH